MVMKGMAREQIAKIDKTQNITLELHGHTRAELFRAPYRGALRNVRTTRTIM